jgi:hypothetical protein
LRWVKSFGRRENLHRYEFGIQMSEKGVKYSCIFLGIRMKEDFYAWKTGNQGFFRWEKDCV